MIFPLYDVKECRNFLVKILFKFCYIIILLYKIGGRRFIIHQLVVMVGGGVKSTLSSFPNIAGKWLALWLSHMDKYAPWIKTWIEKSYAFTLQKQQTTLFL